MNLSHFDLCHSTLISFPKFQILSKFDQNEEVEVVSAGRFGLDSTPIFSKIGPKLAKNLSRAVGRLGASFHK